MGVEQVFVDYFQRAKEYQQNWKTYNALPKKVKARTPAHAMTLKWKPWWKFSMGNALFLVTPMCKAKLICS